MLDLGLVDAIELASVHGWPPTFVEQLSDGWILRATSGLDRGRSCHALTPRLRPLAHGELPIALERVRTWSALHGIRGGLQVSPLEIHRDVVPGLVAGGWEPVWKCWAMVGDRAEALERGAQAPARHRAGAFPWSCARQADATWLATWESCEPRIDSETIETHAATVFRNLGTRGVFGRLSDAATGIAVEDGGGEWAGLFSLVVRQDLRGRGLGRRLVVSLLEAVSAPNIYLQVTMDNLVALGLYESLGFRIVYSYQHLLAPPHWTAGS